MTGGFFAILDDIAMLLDDAAAVTKVSIKKTAGILGDDLAVNAEKAAGFHASRELPVLWAITKGSLLNKLIILPIAFLLSAFAPWLIPPILILGGLYLAYEGAEKIQEFIDVKILKKEVHHETKKTLDEAQKIKSAIVTDFILSIEIIVIALGSVMDESLSMQIIAVSAAALLATVGVYGFVALIVRMDDMGYYLISGSTEGSLKDRLGDMLVAALPKVIKALSVIGTIAMILVAGGILVHNVSFLHHFHEDYFHFVPVIVYDMVIGIVAGYLLYLIVEPIIHLINLKKTNGVSKE